MTTETKSSQPSLQDCLNKIAEALRIVKEGSRQYYLKNASEVSEATLKDVDKSFFSLTNLMRDFALCWIASRQSGPDATEVSPSWRKE